MDSETFDRLSRQLSSPAHRRKTLLALAGAGLLGQGTLDGDDAAGKKKKKRKRKERKLGQTCGGKKKCSQKQGPANCQPFENQECFGVDLTGNRCCGQEGTRCDPSFGSPGALGNCSCCANLFCGEQLDGSFRCQTDDT